MSSQRPARMSGLILTLAGLIFAAALFWWLPHCRGEHAMSCVWMTRAAAGTALMIAALGCSMIFAPTAGSAIGLAAGVFFAGVLETALALVLIGPCPSPMMACHSVTQPVIIVAGTLFALFALADMWRLSRLTH